MTPDTSAEAVERLARCLDGIARQSTTHNSLDRANASDAAATLRALLDERDDARVYADVEAEAANQFKAERDEADAERDRLAEAVAALDAAHAQAAREVERLREALKLIDALDPEAQIAGFTADAARGLVVRMGLEARAALAGEGRGDG